MSDDWMITRAKLQHGARMIGRCAQQVLRSIVLKRVKNWNYRELCERIADGMTLRQFTEFHWQRVPKQKLLKGNPSDADHVAPSLKRHMKAFGHAPQLYGADRGFFSEQNMTSCARSGVSTVCISAAGWQESS
jgi:hypothetical protein